MSAYVGSSKNLKDLKVDHTFTLIDILIYRGTSLIKNSASLGPYSRTMPRFFWWARYPCRSFCVFLPVTTVAQHVNMQSSALWWVVNGTCNPRLSGGW